MNGMIRGAAGNALGAPSPIKKFERTFSRHRHQLKNAARAQPSQTRYTHRPFRRKFARNFPAINTQRYGVLPQNIRYGKAGKPERAHRTCCNAAAATYAILVELDCGLAYVDRLDRTYAFAGTAGRVARRADGQASVFKQTKGVILAQRPVFEYHGSIARARHCFSFQNILLTHSTQSANSILQRLLPRSNMQQARHPVSNVA